MSISTFESRVANVTCSAEEVFNFISDIRNFEQFIQFDKISDWYADKNSFSFRAAPLGSVNLFISETEPFTKVIFSGTALQSNDFSLFFQISGRNNEPARVKVTLNAELNPLLKMMASQPLNQFLAALMDEIEGFRGWKNIRE